MVESIDQEKTDTIAYRGIPYAQPPMNEQPWKPMMPVKPWHGVLKGDEWPTRAPQTSAW